MGTVRHGQLLLQQQGLEDADEGGFGSRSEAEHRHATATPGSTTAAVTHCKLSVTILLYFLTIRDSYC